MTSSTRDAPRLQLRLAFSAMDIVATDSVKLRGVLLRGRTGPVRDALQAAFETHHKLYRVSSATTQEQLHGGIDTAGTLATASVVRQDGLITRAREGALLLASAERLPAALIHSISAAVDALPSNETPGLLVLDESLDDESGIADTVLAERVPLHVFVPDVTLEELETLLAERRESEAVRRAERRAVRDEHDHPAQAEERPDIAAVRLDDNVLKEMTRLAMRLGVDSSQALLACVQTARAHAWLHHRQTVEPEDAAVAVQLTLAPRARFLDQPADAEQAPDDARDRQEADRPEDEVEPEKPAEQSSADAVQEPPEALPEPPTPGKPDEDDDRVSAQELPDRLIEAALAVLPERLLAGLAQAAATRRKREQFGGASACGRDDDSSILNAHRGRPAGVSRPRSRSDVHKVNVLETLKAAIPYQRLRSGHDGARSGLSERDSRVDPRQPLQQPLQQQPRLQIRHADLRVTRFRHSPRTTTVFVVDASGSAAMNRLAEAKGAVELLLGECYVRRDRVALVTFRGEQASLDLSPTRSLTRARRALQSLPGGGGTPLAAGFGLAAELIGQLHRAGELPVCVFMTDGKANIALDGARSREKARADADQQAARLARSGARLIFIDTSPRPQAPASALASRMQARYLPLPRTGARGLPDIVTGRV